MRPNTVHAVITTKDCLAIGGHFYNRNTFDRTLDAAVIEHFFGNTITNTQHPNSFIILFKQFYAYVKIFQTQEAEADGVVEVDKRGNPIDEILMTREQLPSVSFTTLNTNY